MRKMTMLAVMLALAVMSMAASPAMAQDRFDRLENRLDRFDESFFFVDGFDRFDSDDGISQEFDQEADSGDVDQSFEVSSDGDNSNQSVGIQGVTNTGNSQSQFGFTQFDSEIDDFEVEDGGADIDVSLEFDLESDQAVDQAAAAAGWKPVATRSGRRERGDSRVLARSSMNEPGQDVPARPAVQRMYEGWSQARVFPKGASDE